MKSFHSILALLLLFSLVLHTGCSSETEQGIVDDKSTAIAGYKIAPRDMSRIVRVSANVEAENVVTIASRTSGLITQLNAREGDRVNRGEILLRFDMAEQKAELERARAEMELASAVYDRNKKLFEREVISSADYEQVRANKRIAESEVVLLETRLAFGTVTAPMNLDILRRYAEVGDAISANEMLFRAADLNRLVVRPGIPERDVVHFETGQSVDLQIDAFPGQRFDGKIQRIYPAADDVSRLFTVEIILSAEQENRVIRPGYLARISMDADRRENVLAIPSESLLASGPGERFVFVINGNNRLERRDVVTGIERRNWTEILEGLEPGEVIVGANPSNLREDILVSVTRWVEDDSRQVAEQKEF